MHDQGKYLRLFATLFFTFIGFVVAFILLLLAVKLFFGLLSYIPRFMYVYMLFLLLVPAALFISAYIVYFRKTTNHPSKPVRLISYVIFSIALIVWASVFVIDMVAFFKHFYNTIDKYNSYDLFFLAGNVALFFLVGIIQALTTEKEKDWRERRVQ